MEFSTAKLAILEGQFPARFSFSAGGSWPKIRCSFYLKLLKLLRMSSGSKLHIVVDGCIGVGKTTLATKLADFRKAALILEDFDKNPFLADFYRDPVAHVFETETQFLLLHYYQLKSLAKSSTETISDFTFAKDQIFGELNFHAPDEKRVFDEVFGLLNARLRQPDIIIYLKGSDQLIIDRIRQRNRSMEQTIDFDYFKRLRRAYDDFFLSGHPNVHVIEADRFDCLNDPSALVPICSVIDSLAASAPAS